VRSTTFFFVQNFTTRLLKIGSINGIKGRIKIKIKIRASPKATEALMGDHDHPFIINQQGAISNIDHIKSYRQTLSSHIS
jgi:hypothetical protein